MRRFVWLLLCVAFLSIAISAQQPNATLTGVVTDPNGPVIPGGGLLFDSP